jgi:nucleotide-binding universal stress UspA family protein
MKAPRTILVPIDMSAYSLVGVQYAQEIAVLFNAEIIVLLVDDHPSKSHLAANKEARRASCVKSIQHLLIDHDLVQHSMKIEIREGSPASEIIRAADSLGADLIVMSTHGRSGLRQILMGSVAEKVVRMARVPVLTVKPEQVCELIEITEEDVAHDLHAPTP